MTLTSRGFIVRTCVLMSTVALLGAQAYAAEPLTGAQAPAEAAEDAPDSAEPHAGGAAPGQVELAPRRPPVMRDPVTSDWYGSRIMLVDIVSMAALLVGINDEMSDAFGAIGIAGLVFGGPLIHRAMERRTMSAASLGLRVAVPSLLAAVTPRDSSCSDPILKCGYDTRARNAAIGMAGVLLLDWYVMGRARRSVEPAGYERSSWMLTPTVIISESKIGLAVASRF